MAGPAKPALRWPRDGFTDIDVNPILVTTEYSGSSGVNERSYFYIAEGTVYDSENVVWIAAGTTEYLTKIKVDTVCGTFTNNLSGKTRLENNTTYVMRCRHRDDQGWSDESDDVIFTTIPVGDLAVKVLDSAHSPRVYECGPQICTTWFFDELTSIQEWVDIASGFFERGFDGYNNYHDYFLSIEDDTAVGVEGAYVPVSVTGSVEGKRFIVVIWVRCSEASNTATLVLAAGDPTVTDNIVMAKTMHLTSELSLLYFDSQDIDLDEEELNLMITGADFYNDTSTGTVLIERLHVREVLNVYDLDMQSKSPIMIEHNRSSMERLDGVEISRKQGIKLRVQLYYEHIDKVFEEIRRKLTQIPNEDYGSLMFFVYSIGIPWGFYAEVKQGIDINLFREKMLGYEGLIEIVSNEILHNIPSYFLPEDP